MNPVPMFLTNNTSNDLQVTGVRGKDLVDWTQGQIVKGNGGSAQIATFKDIEWTEGDHYDWINLQDLGTNAQYQLYIEDNGNPGGDRHYATFSYYDNDSNEKTSEPLKFPDGCATAEWESDGQLPFAKAQYTLLKTPPKVQPPPR
jgi:hypothetical protein